MGIKKTLIRTAFALSSIFVIGFLLNNDIDLNAAGYTRLPITGTREIDLSFNADDTVNGVDYSGVLRYRACTNCNGNPTGEWSPLTYSNGQTVSSGVQSGTFYINNWLLPDQEGEHEVCVQLMDYAIHGPSSNVGNISRQQCSKVYYDKSAPVISDIILNEGNKFINHGDVPGKFTVTDNRAGIKLITYNDGYGGTGVIPADDIACVKSTNPVEGDGSVSCKVETIFHLNSDTAYNDLELTVYDNVGNYETYGPTRIYFDKVVPEVNLIVPNTGANESINTNEIVVEYHVKDAIEEPWIYPSGIQKIILSNSGLNEKLIMINSDLTKDMDTAVDGMIRDYVMNACPGTLKMEVWDRAGNYSYTEIEIRNCSVFEIENVTMNNVINPNLYNVTTPFEEVSYMPSGVMSPMPQALAGANIEFTITYKWDGDLINKMYGRYMITVRNESGSYIKSFTQDIETDEFIDKGSGIFETVHELKLPTDAPKSTTDDKTYVYIEIRATVETVEDDVIKTGVDMFPDIGDGIIAQIAGSIEDYLWFGETN